MLKPALQLRVGQQLTMTPQLQQAIRLLQLSALDLQQAIREALEQNVMLEAEDEGNDELPVGAAGSEPEANGELTRTEAAAEAEAAPAADGEAESADDAWDEGPTASTSDSPWSGDDRPQEFSDQRGQT